MNTLISFVNSDHVTSIYRYDTVDERPVYLDFTRPDHKKAGAANIRVGVGVMAWSSDGRYLATKCTNLATTVWVWDLAR